MMKDQEHKLINDEVRLLRVEAAKIQKNSDNMFNDWVHEKNELHQEIHSLRDSLEAVETFYNGAKDLRKRESDLLAEQKHKLRMKEDYYIELANQKIEIESEVTQQREKEAEEKADKNKRVIELLRNDLAEAHEEIKKLKDHHNSKIAEIESIYEGKIAIINEKEGVSQYHNQQLKSEIDNTKKTYTELSSNEHLEKIILRNQVNTLSKLTNEKIEKTLLEKENIKTKLDSLIKSAVLIEDEENRYKTTIAMKLVKIQQFMKKVHEVLASTYKSEELELILRDLDEIAEKSGLDLGGKEKSYKKKRMDYEDRISAKMHKTKKEIEKIKSLEDERKLKNLIEKLSIVELSQRLASLISDIEECTSYEKQMMTGEIKQYKEAMIEKENRLNGEIKGIKKERDDLLVKLNTLNLNDQTDQRKLLKILDSYKKDRDSRTSDLVRENQKLQSYATKVTDLLESNNTRAPVNLPNEGRYKALLKSSSKIQKTKKAEYLSKGNNKKEMTIVKSVRKNLRGTKS